MTYEELKQYALEFKNALVKAQYIAPYPTYDGYYECSPTGNQKLKDIAHRSWRCEIKAANDDDIDNITEVWAPTDLNDPTCAWTWYKLSNDPPSIPHLAKILDFLCNVFDLECSSSEDNYIDLDDIIM